MDSLISATVTPCVGHRASDWLLEKMAIAFREATDIPVVFFTDRAHLFCCFPCAVCADGAPLTFVAGMMTGPVITKAL